MRRVDVDRLEAGMILGRTLYAENGSVLLRRGVSLSAQYIWAIRARGFSAVDVFDGFADDVEPQELVSQAVRTAARRHLSNLFAAVRQAPARGGPTALLGEGHALVAEICQDIDRIVSEVLSAETLGSVASLKSYDNYTYEHSIEVAVAAVMLGRRLSLPPAEISQIALGCLVHDIGKIFIPLEILNKDGPLSDEEVRAIRRHPETGYQTARQIVPKEALIAQHVVWQHHERQDGTGYPRGLRGYNNVAHHRANRFEPGRILLPAEIAAVADVYSALASDRPYRPAFEPPKVVAALREMAGPHLNQEVVEAFLAMFPRFPVGSRVRVVSGPLLGHQGVVVEVSTLALDRPTVRLLFDGHAEPIPPIELDLRTAPDTNLELLTARTGRT